MKKKITTCIIICLFMLSTVGFSAIAFADNITWNYDENTKTLTISGHGEMESFADEYSLPWLSYVGEIKSLVVCDGVTSVGANALAGARQLENVILADTVSSIGASAFGSCPALRQLYFSNNVKSIADSSFAYNGLTKKDNFILRCDPAGYPLNYALNNDISISCSSVKCGNYTANVVVRGMQAYYPYTAKVSGKFRFSSTGTHDTYAVLYDENHKLLAEDDDGSGDTNFTLTCDLEKGKTYYFSARIYNSVLTGNFGVKLEAVDYFVSGGIYAMRSQNGDCSNILVDDALIDGETGDGTFSYHLTSNTKLLYYSIAGQSFTYEITPDGGDVQNIAVQMCDMVKDGIINGKDYVKMYKSNSKYLPLWKNFVNERV